MRAKGSGAFGLLSYVIHGIKRDPCTNIHSPQSNRGFLAALPDLLRLMAIFMNDGYYQKSIASVPLPIRLSTFYNERVWLDLYLRTQQAIENLTDQGSGNVRCGRLRIASVRSE